MFSSTFEQVRKSNLTHDGFFLLIQENTLEFLKIDCSGYTERKYLFLKCTPVLLLTIPISHVFTYRSSLIKSIENTGYFTHSKES